LKGQTLRFSLLIPALAAALALSQAALAQDADAGKEAFSSQCRTCHNGTFGPTLRGVVGRKIGSQAEYTNYSDVLKAKADQTWTEENLHAFIKAPNDFAPGTRMTMSMPDDAARANVIAYLKTLKPAE
jgi:cytochrome c